MFQLKFVTDANCPMEKANHVLLGEQYVGIFDDFFRKKNISPIYIPNNPCVDPYLKGHVDLSVFYAGNKEFFLSPYLSDNKIWDNFGQEIKKQVVNCQEADYPKDCNLNIAYNGKYVIWNKKTADNAIVKSLTNRAIEINVKQGYSKCSVCFVNKDSIITGDPGIAASCYNKGLQVLLIDDSFIKLQSFSHGFIGGSSFKLSETEIAFTGTIPESNTKEMIEEFLKERKIKINYMTEDTMIDIGGIIPITYIIER